MSSRTREQRIIAAVPCSECGAAVGEECTFSRAERRKLYGGAMLRGGRAVHGRRREAWQAQRVPPAPPERHIDGRLSDRASHYWPGALVVKEVKAGEVRWWLERVQPGLMARVEIGSDHAAATRGLGAIIRAHQAREAAG